ncbi:SGNH hydrolase [Choiromyces venosus 120613-1]|uniref:SGNH hydrolase n=1 Tax=Choiromyces venosus 120613-1 TaxID=1336337 RepID=A0A3N4JV80_9PEZI|nr:SGNH hydrolase [Choiromyces venosus 120613-1]RPB04034.1 SGNH hydrolase [Choiromyces venosus 120613-1]
MKFSSLSAALMALYPIGVSPVSAAKILMAGDSTMAQSSSSIQGWGVPFAQYISLAVTNLAHGGRSARSYYREGLQAALVAQIQAGDYVIIEFGHNDGGSPATSDRASTFGDGTQTTTVTLANGTVETVQTFVTYEKWFIRDVIAKGGIPVVSSTTPNGDAWNDAHTAMLEPNRFVPYAKMAAGNFTQATYVDHYDFVTIAFETLGYANVYPKLFPNDHTHTSPEGADVVAQAFVNGLTCTNHPLANFLTAAGNALTIKCGKIYETDNWAIIS